MISGVHAASLESSSQPACTAVHVPSLLHRLLVFPIKLFWGMLFCQSLAGSIFIVGWTYRLAQRGALKFWFSRSARPQTSTGFIQFLAGDKRTRQHTHWPNWFAQQNFREEVGRHYHRRFRPIHDETSRHPLRAFLSAQTTTCHNCSMRIRQLVPAERQSSGNLPLC